MSFIKVKNLLLNNKLVQGSIFYFVIGLINSLIPIVILPLVSRSLNLTDFGSYSLYKVFVAFSIPLVGLSLSAAVMRRYYSLNSEEFKSYIFSSLIPPFAALFVMSAVFLIFKLQFVEVLKIESIELVILALFSGAVTSLNKTIITVYRAKNQLRQYFIVNISYIVFYLFVVGVAFFFGWLTLNFVIYGYIFSFLISSLIGLFLLLNDKLIKFSFQFIYVVDMIKYSFPVAMYSLVALVYGLNDKLIINTYLDKKDLAIYAGTSQVALILSKIGSSIQLAWTPYVFEQYKKYGIAANNVKKQTIYMVGFLVVVSLIFTLLYPFVFRIFLPESYSQGLDYFYFFIIASLLQSIYWLYNPLILYVEKNSYLLYISIVSAIISLSLNFYFVKKGVFFVAMAFAISWFIQLVGLLIVNSYAKNSKINPANIH